MFQTFAFDGGFEHLRHTERAVVQGTTVFTSLQSWLLLSL